MQHLRTQVDTLTGMLEGSRAALHNLDRHRDSLHTQLDDMVLVHSFLLTYLPLVFLSCCASFFHSVTHFLTLCE